MIEGKLGMSKYSDMTVNRLKELLRDLKTRKSIEQAIIALENGDQSFQWIGVTGETEPDGKQVLAETPFFIASIDKLYNATIVMMLKETGRLDLDA